MLLFILHSYTDVVSSCVTATNQRAAATNKPPPPPTNHHQQPITHHNRNKHPYTNISMGGDGGFGGGEFLASRKLRVVLAQSSLTATW